MEKKNTNNFCIFMEIVVNFEINVVTHECKMVKTKKVKNEW